MPGYTTAKEWRFYFMLMDDSNCDFINDEIFKIIHRSVKSLVDGLARKLGKAFIRNHKKSDDGIITIISPTLRHILSTLEFRENSISSNIKGEHKKIAYLISPKKCLFEQSPLTSSIINLFLIK